MLGDGSCRLLLYILGYVSPAYACFKAVEQKNSERIREWCIYWLLLALFTTAERLVFDWLIFWIPLYYEAKLLFVVYLWHPKTQGANYLYTAYVQPFCASHEGTVDQSIQEAKTWAADFLTTHFQRLTHFVQYKAHLGISVLQNLQQKKMEEVQGLPTARSTKSTSLDELPSVPTTKLE